MVRFFPIALVGFVLFALWIWAIFDVIATDSSLIRNLPKGMWIVMVIVLPTIGSIAWMLLGRPAYASFAPGGERPRGQRQQPGYKGSGPYGPDSAPRYLAEHEVTDRRSAELDAQLAEWESQRSNLDDLARRQAELDAREVELQRRERELNERDDTE